LNVIAAMMTRRKSAAKGHAPARVSAPLARHSARMVNAKFPDRAGLWFRNGGFARIAPRRSLETGIIRNSATELGNFFRKSRAN